MTALPISAGATPSGAERVMKSKLIEPAPRSTTLQMTMARTTIAAAAAAVASHSVRLLTIWRRRRLPLAVSGAVGSYACGRSPAARLSSGPLSAASPPRS